MRFVFSLFLFAITLGLPRIVLSQDGIPPKTNSVAKPAEKGTLPELKPSDDEGTNQDKALNTEILISKAENQAIVTLQGILKRKKNSPEEPSLWYRLAELYTRRAKTGRFFDLNRDSQAAAQIAPPAIRDESASKNLKKAVEVYVKIESSFPKYNGMDEVLFNHAFASQQLGQKKEAEVLYLRLLKNYPGSELVPDGRLALGEMKYDAGQFAEALTQFVEIEKFPNSRAYSYGLYKQAWSLYNLRKNDEAMNKMIFVAGLHDPRKEAIVQQNYNLRTEALRDIIVFYADMKSANDAYSFFKKITTDAELGEAMINMGKLYSGYSRQKEVVVFLNEFNSNKKSSPFVVKSRMILADAHETLKNRPAVIVELQTLSEICKRDSSFRKTNPTVAEACDMEVAKETLEITKKWWEIWLKNRTHKEFASYTKTAFEIYLERDNLAKPDTKSRFAYAELLFQLEDFRKASQQYEMVGRLSQDKDNQHDSNYAALLSLEKASETKSQSSDTDEILRLALNYLKIHPQGIHHEPVSFKVGLIYHGKKNFAESEKWMRELIQAAKEPEIKLKSQDLLLDIFNQRKDYPAISKLAQSLLTTTSDAKRKQKLTQILHEAEYASLQTLSDQMDKKELAQKYYEFAKKYSDSSLHSAALWEAVSLSFSGQAHIQGADYSVEFYRKYKSDKKSMDALKEAAQRYSELGFLNEAANTFDLLASITTGEEALVFLEASGEIQLLNKNYKEARRIFEKILTKSPARNKIPGLYEKLYETYSETHVETNGSAGAKELAKFEEVLIEKNIEPMASQILLRRLERVYAQKNMAESFRLAKNIVGGNSSEESKAKARLIQAQILEAELKDQSLKTSVERLSVVLNLKAEKLDKAQTAFNSAAKLSPQYQIQLQSLEGLKRSYVNFVDSLKNINLKDDLKPEEKIVLDDELKKLSKPIESKLAELDRRIDTIKSQAASQGSGSMTLAEDLNASDTWKPSPPALATSWFQPFYPQQQNQASVGKKEKCSLDSVAPKGLKEPELLRKGFVCWTQKNWSGLEKVGFEISKTRSDSPIGLYLLSLEAGQTGYFEKSDWLLHLAVKKDSKNENLALFKFHDGLIALQLGQKARAEKSFLQAFDQKFSEDGVIANHARVSYQKGDCLSTLEDLQLLGQKKTNEMKLIPLQIECFAQKGDFDAALSLGGKDTEILLVQARLHEKYQAQPEQALKNYQSARSIASVDSQNESMRKWIQSKIQSLSENKVTSQKEKTDNLERKSNEQKN